MRQRPADAVNPRRWTDAQFAQMSWHDNHVYALRVVAGSSGPGRLVLDLDYILEWQCDGDEDGTRFRLLPVTLTFFEVSALRLSLDYAADSAALGPFSIAAIERREEQRERHVARLWRILVNWPRGEIAFEADGYEQRAWGKATLSAEQWLHPEQRIAPAH